MRQLVDDILAERGLRPNRRRRFLAGATALLGHALLGAAIALAPVFIARSQAHDREYVRVMIVSAKALGDATAATKPAPPRKMQPQPKPAPVVVPTEKTPSPSAKTAEKPKTESKPAPPSRRTAETPGDESAADPEDSRRRGGPDGTSLGTSPFGSSEASFDDPDFRYGYYIDQMVAILGSNWVRPRAGLDTEVVVHYVIARNGRLSNIEVVRESGSRAFDAAAVRAVTLSSPLPPLPQSYPHDALGVTLLVR